MYGENFYGRHTAQHQLQCQQKHLVTSVICYKFKNNLFEIWFYTYFVIISYMYIAPRQGQTTPWGQNLDVNRKASSLCPFVTSLKHPFELILFILFMLLYMYIAPRQGQTNPWGQNFDVNKNILLLRSFVAGFIH